MLAGKPNGKAAPPVRALALALADLVSQACAQQLHTLRLDDYPEELMPAVLPPLLAALQSPMPASAALQPRGRRVLRALTLRRCALDDVCAARLSDALSVLPCLRVLDVAECFMSQAGAEGVCVALVRVPQLRRVDLSHNGVGRGSAAVALATSVRATVHVTSLCLAHTALRDRGTVALAPVLAGVSCLCELDLHECGFGRACAIDALTGALHAHSSSLTHLDIGDNIMRPTTEAQLLATLACCTALRRLDVRACGLDHPDALAACFRCVLQCKCAAAS